MKHILLLTLSFFVTGTLFAQSETITIEEAQTEFGIDERINNWFTPISDFIGSIVFYGIPIKDDVAVYRQTTILDTVKLETPRVDTIVTATPYMDTIFAADGSFTLEQKVKEDITIVTSEYDYVPRIQEVYDPNPKVAFTPDMSSDVAYDKDIFIRPRANGGYSYAHRYDAENGDLLETNKPLAVGQTVDLDGYKFSIDVKEPLAFGEGYRMVVNNIKIPIVLIVLILGALFFTLYFGFVNITKLPLAINVVRGKYDELEGGNPGVESDQVNISGGDNPDTIKVEGQEGEISHFQALTAALSATVGLGNIAGVAIAIVLGGPGATFWMILAGLLGMSSKFVECTLGVKYREVDADGTVHGGPMYYLSKGLKERGLGGFGKVLGVFFAIMCVGGSFGGGNMFQANQAASQFLGMIGAEGQAAGAIFGVILMVFVGIVIIGGIKRIGSVAEKIVPFMVFIYVAASIIILVMNFGAIGSAFGLIFEGAFTPMAVAGGFIGVLIQGFKRAAFSNEAGVGSAAIAHSAVKTKYAASEGIVALLEPFIDTVVVCTMTALVIIVTGNYINPDGLNGVDLTSQAFNSAIPGFSYILTIAVVLFAFSSMLSWSYYGLQSWKYLFGKGKVSDTVYKVLFCLFVVIGSAASLGSVINFSDAMVFAMVFPNIIGLIFLAPVVKKELKKYLDDIKVFKSKKA